MIDKRAPATLVEAVKMGQIRLAPCVKLWHDRPLTHVTWINWITITHALGSPPSTISTSTAGHPSCPKNSPTAMQGDPAHASAAQASLLRPVRPPSRFFWGSQTWKSAEPIRRLSSLTIKRRVFPKPIVGLCTNREQDHDGQSENVKR